MQLIFYILHLLYFFPSPKHYILPSVSPFLPCFTRAALLSTSPKSFFSCHPSSLALLSHISFPQDSLRQNFLPLPFITSQGSHPIPHPPTHTHTRVTHIHKHTVRKIDNNFFPQVVKQNEPLCRPMLKLTRYSPPTASYFQDPCCAFLWWDAEGAGGKVNGAI